MSVGYISWFSCIQQKMKIELTAGQAVLAHGWIRARTFLTWGDIANNDKLNFTYLLNTLELSEKNLYELQPDIQAWIKSSKVTLEDSPSLTLWEIHPIRDFKCDLSDLIRMQWDVTTFKKLGIDMNDLIQLGLSPETMSLFRFSLMNWMQIGMRREHCSMMPESTVFRLFGISKIQALSCLH